MEKLFEAQCVFEKILSIDANYLKSYQNLDNVKNQLVERWHFGMLNDSDRNRKYKAAIGKAIQQRNQVSVLDIGTGSGLLAIYAHELGAAQTIACESTPLMCHIASEAFRRNGCSDQIKLIPKHSTKLDPQSDLGGKVDLIVTETMDCGVFGEGLLDTLIHAKENLLKSNGQIIPGRVKIFVAGFQSRQLAMQQNVVNSSCFTDTIYVQNYSLSSNNREPYDSCHIQQLKDFKLITKVEEALDVNLNNLDELTTLANGQLKKNIRLAYINPESILDGFCAWFEVALLDADSTLVVSTDPFKRDASIGEEPCCWESCIFRLKHRFTNSQVRHYDHVFAWSFLTGISYYLYFYSQKLQNLNVTVSAANGVLKIDHYYDAYGKSYSMLTSDMVKFLNDTELINGLEFDVFAEIQKRFGKIRPTATSTGKNKGTKQEKITHIDSMLDFLPFPTVGIALLKERRLKTLYCSKEAMEFVSFIADSNCIPLDSIVFIDDPHDTLFINEKFDLIILPLIDSYGTLNSAQTANYGILKENKLTPKGFMLPEQVEVMCNIIQSGWLRTATRVIDPEVVDRLQIGSLVNEYATTLHLDLYEDFKCKNLYEAYRTANVQLHDGFYEISHKLYIGDEKCTAGSEPAGTGAIHGVLFYFNILLTSSSKNTISTKRKNSFARLACYIFNENDVHRDNGFITLKYRQNSGVMKIDLK